MQVRHAGVHPVARRQRPGRARVVPARPARKVSSRDVVDGDDVGVARAAGRDALLADELAPARTGRRGWTRPSAPSRRTSTVAREQEVHRRWPVRPARPGRSRPGTTARRRSRRRSRAPSTRGRRPTAPARSPSCRGSAWSARPPSAASRSRSSMPAARQVAVEQPHRGRVRRAWQAAVTAAPTATWSGWPENPSGPKVRTTSGRSSSSSPVASVAQDVPGRPARGPPSGRSRHRVSTSPSSWPAASQLLLAHGRQGRAGRHRASRIWPAPPRVSETTRTSAPSSAYRASVPPAQTVSSSGCAKTPSSRSGRRPAQSSAATSSNSAVEK